MHKYPTPSLVLGNAAAQGWEGEGSDQLILFMSYLLRGPYKKTKVDKKGKANPSLLSVQQCQAMARQSVQKCCEGWGWCLSPAAVCQHFAIAPLLEAIAPTAGSVEGIVSAPSARYRLNCFILQGLQKQVQLRKLKVQSTGITLTNVAFFCSDFWPWS